MENVLGVAVEAIRADILAGRGVVILDDSSNSVLARVAEEAATISGRLGELRLVDTSPHPNDHVELPQRHRHSIDVRESLPPGGMLDFLSAMSFGHDGPETPVAPFRLFLEAVCEARRILGEPWPSTWSGLARCLEAPAILELATRFDAVRPRFPASVFRGSALRSRWIARELSKGGVAELGFLLLRFADELRSPAFSDHSPLAAPPLRWEDMAGGRAMVVFRNRRGANRIVQAYAATCLGALPPSPGPRPIVYHLNVYALETLEASGEGRLSPAKRKAAARGGRATAARFRELREAFDATARVSWHQDGLVLEGDDGVLALVRKPDARRPTFVAARVEPDGWCATSTLSAASSEPVGDAYLLGYALAARRGLTDAFREGTAPEEVDDDFGALLDDDFDLVFDDGHVDIEMDVGQPKTRFNVSGLSSNQGPWHRGRNATDGAAARVRALVDHELLDACRSSGAGGAIHRWVATGGAKRSARADFVKVWRAFAPFVRDARVAAAVDSGARTLPAMASAMALPPATVRRLVGRDACPPQSCWTVARAALASLDVNLLPRAGDADEWGAFLYCVQAFSRCLSSAGHADAGRRAPILLRSGRTWADRAARVREGRTYDDVHDAFTSFGATLAVVFGFDSPGLEALAWDILSEGRDLLALCRMSARWHDDPFLVAGAPQAGAVRWPVLFEGRVDLGDGFVALCLADREALIREGLPGTDEDGARGLHHCVAGYAPACAGGGSQIVSLRYEDGERVSTVEFGAGGAREFAVGSTRIGVVQHKARRNASPPPEAERALDRLCRMLERGQVEVRDEAVARLAAAAANGPTHAFGGIDLDDLDFFHLDADLLDEPGPPAEEPVVREEPDVDREELAGSLLDRWRPLLPRRWAAMDLEEFSAAAALPVGPETTDGLCIPFPLSALSGA